MALLDNPDAVKEEEEEETEKKEQADEDIPEVVEDDLVKTPGTHSSRCITI